MTGQNVRAFLLHVRIEDDDPAVFGPYTERKATELADDLNAAIEAGDFKDRFGYIHASAQRIDNPQTLGQVKREFGL